eukprot:1159096-Pelagomonas_calceolata.AAC.1
MSLAHDWWPMQCNLHMACLFIIPSTDDAHMLNIDNHQYRTAVDPEQGLAPAAIATIGAWGKDARASWMQKLNCPSKRAGKGVAAGP